MEKHFISTTNLTILFLSLSFLELFNFSSNAQPQKVEARPQLPDKVKIGNGPKMPDKVKLGNGPKMPDKVKLGNGPKMPDKVKIGPQVLFPYSLELNQADDATYDNATSNWVQFVDLFDHHELQFTYTLHNKIVAKPGKIIGNIDGTPLIVPQSFTHVVTAIPANENFQSKFLANPIPPGVHSLKLYYVTQGFGLNVHTHRFEPFDSIAASAEFTYVVNMTMVDKDNDGIDDRIEHNLLEKFRPYFKYSSGESHNPTDCIWYVKLSSGYSDPSLILFPATNIMSTKGPSKSSCIGPDAQQSSLAEKAYSGAPWDQEIAATARNIGLYGHVVPIKLVNPDQYDLGHAPSSSDQGKTYYKVEYWQFYGYNIGCFDADFDHQGDWTTVQLIINPDNMQPVVVLHYAHGSIESRFCLDKPSHNDIEVTKEGESVMNYEGSNYNPNLVIDASNGTSLAGTYTSDNELLFYKDPITNEWSHPVVYVEKGSHEYYPTKAWFVSTCPNHDGDGYSFLANTPPNLGEVEHPLTETPYSEIILQYSAKWGCSAGKFNSPPSGPSLHSEWTYPASSTIRWLLKDLGR